MVLQKPIVTDESCQIAEYRAEDDMRASMRIFRADDIGSSCGLPPCYGSAG
jgi:hypothetical protein